MTSLSSEGTTEPRRRASNGWLSFAALILFLDGSFNVIDGLVALFKKSAYGHGPEGLVVFNFTAWGWIMLVIGVTQVIVAVALPKGSMWARITALCIVSISAISQIAFITVFPIWSVIVIALDVLVAWAILVYVPLVDA
jgi:hypothetical protein